MNVRMLEASVPMEVDKNLLVHLTRVLRSELVSPARAVYTLNH